MSGNHAKCSTFCAPGVEPCSISANGKCAMEGRPSCFNRPPYKEFVEVQRGWTEDGRRDTTFVPDGMYKGCPSIKPPFGEAYLKGWKCTGCRWNNISD